MKYTCFEDLPAWQAAAFVGERTLALFEAGFLRGHAGLRDQLARAVVSISNNIAEGFERGSTTELITFLYYAKGSAGETRSMLTILERRASDRAQAISDFKSEISDLRSRTESISRQLGAWLTHLQNTDIEGPRHLTNATREQYARRRRAQDFQKKLEQLAPRPKDPQPDTGDPP